MKYLLDTHVILWALVGDERINQDVKDILYNVNNEIMYSSVSTWEVAIKHNKKESFKLTEDQFAFLCNQNGLSNISINNKHVCELKKINKTENIEHNDPFDLMLLAQAISENAIFITHDRKFKAYSNKNIMLI